MDARRAPDLVVAERIQHLIQGLKDSFLIELGGHRDVLLGRVRLADGDATGVVVAERAAAHGGRLAAEPARHDVMAGFDHGLAFRGDPSPRPPPRGIFCNFMD